jgi:hypothetical protein
MKMPLCRVLSVYTDSETAMVDRTAGILNPKIR